MQYRQLITIMLVNRSISPYLKKFRVKPSYHKMLISNKVGFIEATKWMIKNRVITLIFNEDQDGMRFS